MNRIARLMVVTTSVAFLALAMMGSTVASASTPTRAATHMSVPGTQKAIPTAPSGCNNGNLCEYNSGNGGNLCFQWHSSGDWPGACEYQNEGEYNRHGNAVYLQGNVNRTYCTYLLYSGHYLLYNAKDYFQGSNDTCTDATLEHKLYSNLFV